jgi:hypothetical protein
MHHHDSPGPNSRRLTQQRYPSPRQSPQEIVLHCQIGDRILIGDSVGVLVLDVCGDEVVLGFNEYWQCTKLQGDCTHLFALRNVTKRTG